MLLLTTVWLKYETIVQLVFKLAQNRHVASPKGVL